MSREWNWRSHETRGVCLVGARSPSVAVQVAVWLWLCGCASVAGAGADFTATATEDTNAGQKTQTDCFRQRDTQCTVVSMRGGVVS